MLVPADWTDCPRGPGGIHSGRPSCGRPEARLVGVAIAFYLHDASWSSWGGGPICFRAQFPPLDLAWCHRAFSLHSSRLISELVHEAISPSHPVINKCHFRGKIDGGHVIKLARQNTFCTGSHSSASRELWGEAGRKGIKRFCESAHPTNLWE